MVQVVQIERNTPARTDAPGANELSTFEIPVPAPVLARSAVAAESGNYQKPIAVG